MDEPEQPTRGDDVESESDRRIANVVLVLILVILVGGGIWLTNAMLEQRTQLRAADRGAGALISASCAIPTAPPGCR